MTTDQSLDDSLFAALAARSRVTNLRRVSELTDVLRGWQRTGEVAPAEHQEVIHLAHQVVGSAGTFGYDAVSTLGRELEELAGVTPQPDVDQVNRWLDLASAMRRELGD